MYLYDTVVLLCFFGLLLFIIDVFRIKHGSGKLPAERSLLHSSNLEKGIKELRSTAPTGWTPPQVFTTHAFWLCCMQVFIDTSPPQVFTTHAYWLCCMRVLSASPHQVFTTHAYWQYRMLVLSASPPQVFTTHAYWQCCMLVLNTYIAQILTIHAYSN